MTGGRKRGGTRRRGWRRRGDHHTGEQSVLASEPAGPGVAATGGAGSAEPAGPDAQASLDQVLRRAADARRPEPEPPD